MTYSNHADSSLLNTCICMHACMHVRTYACVYTYTHTHMYMYIQDSAARLSTQRVRHALVKSNSDGSNVTNSDSRHVTYTDRAIASVCGDVDADEVSEEEERDRVSLVLYVRTCIRTYVHTCIYIHTYIYTCTHTHTYIYI